MRQFTFCAKFLDARADSGNGNCVEFSLPDGPLGEIGIDDQHLPYRIDRWDANGISEHLADIDELIAARAIYEAARKRWPGERITLRQGARVIEGSQLIA